MRDVLQGLGAKRAVRTARAASLLLVAFCAGCASGGSIATAGLDRDIVTGSVPDMSSESASDEATIRNAVSSADIAALGGKPLAWANRETGSAGAVEAIEEFSASGRVCRRFNASRESYEGVHLYAGTACLADGIWRMTRFTSL